MAKIIIVGLGAMGSSAAFFSCLQGHEVIGIEAFEACHNRGASHGQSRIIRKAYFEDPDYIPLLHRAYDNWNALERRTGKKLLHQTGGIYIGPPDCDLVAGSLRSCIEHGLEHEMLTAEQVRQRFPFNPPDGAVALYEDCAGFLQPEVCVRAYLDEAIKLGADLHFGECVQSFDALGDGVRVQTDKGTYTADKLIITAGPWAGEVLKELNLPLTVRRVVNAHFESDDPERFSPDKCPIYCLVDGDTFFYGFPRIDHMGVKVGKHNKLSPCTPATIDRNVTEEEIAELRAAVDQYLPGAASKLLATLTCMYTCTPDENFILDFHPRSKNVVYGCGFSGHGFKFASVIGEILMDLATKGDTAMPIGFLSALRFVKATAAL
jgi:sarcosine oxidase